MEQPHPTANPNQFYGKLVDPVFGAAVIDPPWPERGGGKIKRGADRHYDLLKVKDMPAVIRDSGVFTLRPNAHVYLWVTNNYLPDGLWLLKELGIRYITNIVWTKPRTGIGQYFRGKHELVLFGVKGKGKDPSVYQDTRKLSTVLDGAIHSRIHSRKPDALFDLVEARSKGPYVELFGAPELPARPGWRRWGAQRHIAQP